MLEAYKKHKTLRDLEALLPEEVEAVKQTLEGSLESGSSNSLALSILAQMLSAMPGAGQSKAYA